MDLLSQHILEEINKATLTKSTAAPSLRAKRATDLNEVEQVLKDALENKFGWRARARKALGLMKLKKCENCGLDFRCDGRRKIYCSIECFQEVTGHKKY